MADPAARILANYEGYDEDKRLSDPYGRLEERHTREVIARYLGPAPQVVCDVGGGTGPYAFWLAGLGHRVHLSDLVPRHIETALCRDTLGVLASAEVCDARATAYPAGLADLVVLNGPLYHLVEPGDRAAVLSEMRRILKPGGLLLAVFIGRFSGLSYALASGHIFDDDYFRLVRGELADGVRRNQDGRVRTFLEAKFHTPDEALAECRAAGWTVEQTVGLVGPSWMVPDLGAALDDPGRRERLMETSRLMEAHLDHAPKFALVCRPGLSRR